ncbi:MAG: tetratricopeptide repeat protein [Nitrospiraceae bacterium]|nr:tetratricopeptide repeat protein [Nitrospiraceae bacterium]
MSLLADLLSKVKADNSNSREVPPDLKKVVDNAAGKQRITKRMLLLSLFVIVSVVAGFLSVMFLEKYLFRQPQQIVISRPAPAPAEQMQPPAVQKPEPSKQTEQPLEQKPALPVANAVQTKPAPVPAPVQKQKAEAPELPKAQPAPAMPAEKPAKPADQPIQPKKETPAPKPLLQTNISAYDTNIDIHLYTAKNHEARKEYKQAFENYKKALDLSPNNYIIMNNIAGALVQMGSYPEAIKYAKESLRYKKDYLPSLINLVIANIKSGNESEGEGYLSQALSIDPSNRYALLNLAILQENRKEYDKAYNTFSTLAGSGSSHGWTGMARILEKQGRSKEAAALYREILSMDSAGQDAKKTARERLQLLD